LRALPSSIGEMVGLTGLDVNTTPISDLPSSFGMLTALEHLSFQDAQSDHPALIGAGRALVSHLPLLRNLESLSVEGAGNRDMLRLGRSLQKWPLPRLRCLEMVGRYFCRIPDPDCVGLVHLNECWQQMGLPEEANGWSNEQILDYFRTQQNKIEAFMSGSHRRLGAESRVSRLPDDNLKTIAEMVLMRREAEEMQGLVLPSEIKGRPERADFETSSVNEDNASDYGDESFSNSDEDEDEAHGMD